MRRHSSKCERKKEVGVRNCASSTNFDRMLMRCETGPWVTVLIDGTVGDIKEDNLRRILGEGGVLKH